MWKLLTEIFSNNEEETIEYFKNCSEGQLEWICEVFESISEKLKSKKFIDTLELLEKKFPNLDLSVDTAYAKKICLQATYYN